MNKIICDLCGTSYSDTLTQCPICGTAKSETATISDAETANSADGYTYVRGGRFSKSNVNKRNQSEKSVPAKEPVKERTPARQQLPRREKPNVSKEPEKESNLGLIIVVVVLLLVIVSVCAYIAIRVIDLSQAGNSTGTTQGTTSTAPQIPCTAITMSQGKLEFTSANKTVLLQPQLQPADTTDKVYYISTDERIVTVDSDGLVTPVADGQAFITVICGGVQTQIEVVCNMGVAPPVDPTTPSGPTGPDPTEPSKPVRLQLNRVEFMLFKYGDFWDLTRNSEDPYYPGVNYAGPEDPSEVIWTTDDPSIVTIENGVVTAVGNGTTMVHGEYNGKTAHCKVTCINVVVPPATDYKLTGVDFTIGIGERFHLELLHKENAQKVQNAVFRSEDPSVAEVDASGWVTGVSKGTITIYVEHEGITYECIVRVVIR